MMKGEIMYSTTITQSGQITLPKELREFLGVKVGEKVIFEKEENGVTIRRKLSREEFFAELDKNVSPKTRKAIKRNAGKTVSEMISNYMRSPKGQKEMRMKYAI